MERNKSLKETIILTKLKALERCCGFMTPTEELDRTTRDEEQIKKMDIHKVVKLYYSREKRNKLQQLQNTNIHPICSTLHTGFRLRQHS